MVIDADGLFNGARWRKCSNAARLNAPYLLLAANGYGRLEIDAVRIIARAYASFDPRPTEGEILGWIREYAAANLLFPYDADGQAWGAWDTPDRLLAKYKSAADRRSPAPPEPAFSEWRSRYRSEGKDVATFPKSFENISEKFSENSPSGIGIGLGIGVGKGKNICASDDARVNDPPVSSSKKSTGQQDELFAEFWSEYSKIRNRDKKRAAVAFKRAVSNREALAVVMAALAIQTPEMMRREPAHRPHASTWLNGRRWEDSPEEIPAFTGRLEQSGGAVSRRSSIADAVRAALEEE